MPGADWLIKGKRYLTVASAGIGKTLATSVVAVEIVINGGTVVVLDVENGADGYARRLEDILEAREDTKEAMSACTKRLRYYEYPALSLRWSDGEWITACAGADLVIFDSSRRVLSSVGLAEDTSDDYAKFVERLIIPLNRVGITTLILDNTGHENTDRARGTKAKEDLNEVIFSLNVAEDFDAAHDREADLAAHPATVFRRAAGDGPAPRRRNLRAADRARDRGRRRRRRAEVPPHRLHGEGLPLRRVRRRLLAAQDRQGGRRQGEVHRPGDPEPRRRGPYPARAGPSQQPAAPLDHALSGG